MRHQLGVTVAEVPRDAFNVDNMSTMYEIRGMQNTLFDMYLHIGCQILLACYL